MLKMLKTMTATGLLLALLTPTSTWAGNSQVHKLMDITGITDQIRVLPEIMKLSFSGAGSQGASLPPAAQQAFVNAIDQSFHIQKFEQTVENQLAKDLSPQDLTTLLDWYKTGPAKTIIAAEKAAITPEAMVDMQMQAATLMKNSSRMAFARRLDGLMGATDSAMSMQEYTGIAMLSAMASSQAGGAMDMDMMKQLLSTQLEQQQQMVADQIAVQIVYTYRNLDDATLEDYEKTLKPPAFKKFYQSGMSAMNRGTENFITDWADVVAASDVLQ